MDFMLWCLNIAWKVLIVCMGWMLFRYIVRNGKGTFSEVLDTIGIALKTFGHAIRKWCLNYLKKEESATQPNKDAPDVHKAYEEYCKDQALKIKLMSFEEFEQAMLNKETFHID